MTIDESWLPDMFGWLTDPVINHMARVGEITVEGQRRWFEGLEGRDDYWIRGIVDEDGRRLGAYGLRHINAYAAEVFAYVGPSDARGVGIGRWTLLQCEQESQKRGLVRLWGIAAEYNAASRRTLRGLDYVTVGPYEDWGLFVEKLVPGRQVAGPP
jgi:GNAT superfamily N-acetyltransferase